MRLPLPVRLLRAAALCWALRSSARTFLPAPGCFRWPAAAAGGGAAAAAASAAGPLLGPGPAWAEEVAKAGAQTADAGASGGYDDAINAAYTCFYIAILLALVKNNLVDGNGPLAGVLGMRVRTCKASHILVETEEEAKKLAAELAGGEAGQPSLEEFAALAEAHSTCPSAKKGGNLGKISQGTMVPEFDQVCFDDSKEEGVPIGPVRSEFGYHLIWIKEREPAEATA